MDTPIPASFMSGTKNTFIIADVRSEKVKSYLRQLFPNLSYSQISAKICSQTKTEKIDGVVFVVSPPPETDTDFAWDFYNADGSSAEMCGNAARCVAQFAVDHLIAKNNLSFQSIAGVIYAQVFGNHQVKVQMTELKNIITKQEYLWNDQSIQYSFINSGVPHVVVQKNSLDNLEELRPLAKSIRSHERFKPQGTNVTFYAEKEKGRIQAISFERGVEDFTQACGTGAVAAAKAYQLINENSALHVHVFVPGGELVVELGAKNPVLEGPVEYVEKHVDLKDWAE